MLEKIWRYFITALKSIWNNLCAISMIAFRGRKRYLYNELSRLLNIENDKKNCDGLITVLLETIRGHQALAHFSSRLLKSLNFPNDKRHLDEVISLVEQMIRNNAESVKIKQENDMLLNQLKEATVSNNRLIAEFIVELDYNTGFLNMLEEISKCDSKNVSVTLEELQSLLYEVFSRFTAGGLKRILEPEDLKTLTPEKLKHVKMIGDGINIEQGKCILANKGWRYKDCIIVEAILRKRQ